MKKPLLIVICLFIAFSSCKKADVPPTIMAFSATVDGTLIDFSTNAVAQMSSGVAYNSNLSITGASGSGSGADFMSISMSASATIAKGTVYTSTSTTGYLALLYTKGLAPSAGLYSTDVKGVYVSTVTITAVNGTNIQGTFSGKLIYTDNVNSKAITGGSFNVTVK